MTITPFEIVIETSNEIENILSKFIIKLDQVTTSEKLELYGAIISGLTIKYLHTYYLNFKEKKDFEKIVNNFLSHIKEALFIFLEENPNE